MKNSKYFLIGFLILIIGFGCKKKENLQKNHFISAKVDGKIWEGTQLATTTRSLVDHSSYIISGSSTDDGIILEIFDYTGPKTYQLGGSSLNIAQYATKGLSTVTYLNNFQFGTGILVMQKVGDYIEGTFNFTCRNQMTNEVKKITDGKCKIKAN